MASDHIPATTHRLPVGDVFASMTLGPRQVRAGLVLFVAFVLEAWEMLGLVYIGADVRASLHIDEAALGLLISALFFGMIPGALVFGVLADRLGRRRICTWSLALYGVCTALAAFAPNYQWLVVTRFAAGFALSGLHVMAFPYFEELLPVRVRGKATVYLSSGWALGILLAVGSTALLGAHGWRVVVFANALVGLWALAISAWVPESPYWLAARGRQREARSVLIGLGADISDRTELTATGEGAGSITAVFRLPLRWVTVQQLLLNFALSWGYWGLQTGLPTLLTARGLSLPSTLSFTALSALVMIPGYISASFLTRRFGRRWVFIVYIGLAAVGGAVFASAPNLTLLYLGNFVVSFFSLGAFGVWNTWLGELYPTAVRGVGYSWGIFSQRVANAVVPSVVGFMLAGQAGFGATTAFIDAFLIATALCALGLPETESKPLQ